MDVIKRIQNANKGRDPERLCLKYRAMRENPFVFLRGTCHLFYDRLPKDGICKSAPLVWCCGDLHLENFGSYKGENRLVYFDINDFDEAALAPATWELARIVSSILVGADSYGISHKDALYLSQYFIQSYAQTLVTGKAGWIERDTAHGVVKTLLEQCQLRSRAEFLNTRTEKKGKHRRFKCDGKKTLAASEAQKQQVSLWVEQFAATQHNPDFFKVIDIARRIAGTGSLGVERYAILVQGKGDADSNYLLDIKQAMPSSIAKHLPVTQPAWANHAERIVSLQQRMQANSMAFLHAIDINKTSYVLRGLQASEDRVPIGHYHQDMDKLKTLLANMAQCLAWAQLRSSGRQQSAIADELIDYALHKKWRNKLLDMAQELSQQVENDWADYCEAYDHGVFG